VEQPNLAVGLYGISKDFRRYGRRNRRLRRDAVNLILGKPRRDETWRVLDRIDLEVCSGETLAILGRNACGKSTLLKLIAGILQPTEGRVVTQGSVCTLLDVGTGFHEELTGRENIFINGAILGMPRRYLRMIVPEIEEFSGLDGFLDTPLKYYSSGMRARLGFAVAMSADPDIFLIDEVLAVGDEGFRRKCYVKLEETVSRGATLIIVSHDISAIQRLCARGVWIHDAAIRADGPIHQVCGQYMDYFNSTTRVAGRRD
jgi:ABC-type polysaccharide/polyol phosphate transport system ATPase subunit